MYAFKMKIIQWRLHRTISLAHYIHWSSTPRLRLVYLLYLTKWNTTCLTVGSLAVTPVASKLCSVHTAEILLSIAIRSTHYAVVRALSQCVTHVSVCMCTLTFTLHKVKSSRKSLGINSIKQKSSLQIWIQILLDSVLLK